MMLSSTGEIGFAELAVEGAPTMSARGSFVETVDVASLQSCRAVKEVLETTVLEFDMVLEAE